MTEEDMISVLDRDNSDEESKKELIKKLVSLDTPPSEPVIQALMRIIKKPSIPEASQGVFDDTVDYLKSICRY